jgi:hypothetical protein
MKDLGSLARVADRKQENGNRIGVGSRDAGKRVLGARSGLHGKHADAFAIADSGEAVGDADADALLAADYGANPGRSRGFDQRIGWIAGEELHGFAFENLADDVNDSHGTSSFTLGCRADVSFRSAAEKSFRINVQLCSFTRKISHFRSR